jgi:hypothetical protein
VNERAGALISPDEVRGVRHDGVNERAGALISPDMWPETTSAVGRCVAGEVNERAGALISPDVFQEIPSE